MDRDPNEPSSQPPAAPPREVRTVLVEDDPRDAAERRRAADRAERLQALTAALVSALSPAEVARVSVAHGGAALGAQRGGCWLLAPDGRALELAGHEGYDDAVRTAFARVPLEARVPIAAAVRRGAPLWLETRAALRAEYPEAERAVGLPEGAETAVACVPLQLVGDQPLGALAFTFDRARAIAPEDRALLVTIARQCAQALDRARLYAAERDASQRFALLARASDVLGASLEYETTLQNVAGLAMPLLADFGFFDVREGASGEVRRIARAHDDPATEALLATTRWVRSERTDINLCALSSGRAGRHPDIDDAWMQNVAVNPGHLALLRRLAFCSMITVPLELQGRTLGALTLFFARSGRRHSESDLRLAEELAHRAASAVENARLFRDAQEANRLKDEFLATVSHELRTPLTAMLGWTRMLRTGALPEDKRARALETIERNATAQAQLIEDLLDINRIVTGKLRLNLAAVDPAAVVEMAVEAVRPAAEARGVHLELELGDGAGPLMGDAERLQQIVWNLLSNAVKFTARGGRVATRLRREGEHVELSVADTGQGIAPEFLPHAFERFRQADASATRQQGGLGLGLAIVRHLVELHGGTVEARSEGLGRGATFTVRLPVAALRAAGGPPPVRALPFGATAAAAGSAARLEGVRVLVVDDEPDARELVASALEAVGASVETAAGPGDAFASLRRAVPDVIVSDLGMPDEDGYSLIRRVRALPPEHGGRVPALALTAYARIEDRTAALATGFTAHTAKPVEPAELARIVATLAGRAPRA